MKREIDVREINYVSHTYLGSKINFTHYGLIIPLQWTLQFAFEEARFEWK